MGKSTPSAPAAPDPAATAAAQSATNKETAVAQANLNRINQYTPQGSLVYEKIGTNEDGTPQYKQTTTYSPEQQQLYNLSNQANQNMGQTANEQLQRLQKSLAQPISYDGAPALQNGMDPATQAKAEAALMERLNPQLDRDRAALEAKLANQGLALNSEAYNKAMDAANRQANDQRSQAALQAIQLGQSTANQNNQARQQYIQEAASIRNQPLNEISALLSGTQVSAPQFTSVPQSNVANTDYMSAANLQYQGQLANWNAQNQANNAAMGGLFGLGGAALGAGLMPGGFLLSDRRLKRDITKLGKWRGFNLYRFKYLWDDIIHMGVMAQEVEKSRPDAVVQVGGFKAVNYGAL